MLRKCDKNIGESHKSVENDDQNIDEGFFILNYESEKQKVAGRQEDNARVKRACLLLVLIDQVKIVQV